MPEGIVNVAEVLAHTEGGVPIELGVDMFSEDPSLLRKGQFEERATPRVKATEAEKWQRRMEMAALHSQGKYQKTIAKMMGVSESFVSQEITALVNEFRAEALKSLGERIAKEQALIYMVQLEAIQAWYESKSGKRITTRKKIDEWRKVANFNRRGKAKSLAERYDGANTHGRIMDGLDEIFGEQYDPDVAELDALVQAKEEETERIEESPGQSEFLKIIIECSKYRAELDGYYKSGSTPGSGSKPGGEGDENFAAWTPQMRIKRLNSLLDKGRMKEATQKAISQANAQATATQLNRAPLRGLFEQRMEQMTKGEPAPRYQPVVTTPPIATQEEGDPLWDAS